ncbi:MAG: hypothetical protein BSOLF_1675 [Candidatus Carbobacillus altaicus]|uniref:Uncharacterized protein n=1 Tax=Candidatus Carbonibacillus altaicus TaxID=2163959 RepID=A0A2R6Y3U5_9BACL|nr:MAG: hypothetical protein BSOLF_1675 [Candidatus Carbobacillus altaicus]
MSADLEGIAGIVHPEQFTPEGVFYPEARRLLTEEINVVVEALKPKATYCLGATGIADRFPGLDEDLIRLLARAL